MTDTDDPHGTRSLLLDEIARLEAEVERLRAELIQTQDRAAKWERLHAEATEGP